MLWPMPPLQDKVSMSTKGIDRDLMFHPNKMPNYKQTESSQTHCTNQWFFPDK